MAIIPELKEILQASELSFEEVRAFEIGLSMLTKEEQEEFTALLVEDIGLVYPLYINFKAKLHAIEGTDEEWLSAIENEVKELELYLSKKKVGDEIN